MSLEATLWFYAAEKSHLSPGEVLVLGALCWKANEETEHAWPTKKTLSGMTGLNERSVDRAFNRLLDGGIIRTIGKPPQGRRAHRVTFRPEALQPRQDAGDDGETNPGDTPPSTPALRPSTPAFCPPTPAQRLQIDSNTHERQEIDLVTFGAETGRGTSVRAEYDDGPDKANPFATSRSASKQKPPGGYAGLVAYFQEGLNRVRDEFPDVVIPTGANEDVLVPCFKRLRGRAITNDGVRLMIDYFMKYPNDWLKGLEPSKDFARDNTINRIASRVLSGNTSGKGSVDDSDADDYVPRVKEAKEFTWQT